MNPTMVMLVSVILALGACTTTRPVDATNDLSVQLQPGDRLVVYERTGRKLDMELKDISTDRLTGALRSNDDRAVEVRFTDIVKIEVREVDRTKTAGVVIGTILGAALVIGLHEMPPPGFIL